MVFMTAIASAAQEVRTGPPPEIRALVDATMAALNSGSTEAWDKFAQERFTPAHLKQRPAAERRSFYEKLRVQFGTFTFERAMRQGPDAPLDLHLRGSTGAAGVLSIEIEGTDVPKIAGLTFTTTGKSGDSLSSGTLQPPVHGRMTSVELSTALDAFLSRLTTDDVFSGVALVAKAGEIVFHKAYGFADRANRRPNTPETRFNIGSINKTFTQLAIGQLVAAGKLKYTDTLGALLPDYPQGSTRAATVDELLTHRAGVADFFGPAFTNAPKDRFRSNADYYRYVGALPPLFAPGERSQYCNGCYIVLGAIVERVSGMPYERYVAERIFKPADMTSTGYPQVDAIESNVALGYTRRGPDGTLRSNVYLHGASGSAAGGGYSTASDLLAYVNARRNGRLPKDTGGIGIAGGAPGTSAVVEANATWTVVVLANLDPPAGERLGVAIMEALTR